MDIENTPEAAAVAEIVRAHIKPQVITVTGQGGTATEILILPKDLAAKGIKPFLDEYLAAPERRQGTAVMTDLDSLIAHVNRFRDADSALFADDDRGAPALFAVLNYHRARNPLGEAGSILEGVGDAQPRFGDHRAAYRFPLAAEWKAWHAIDDDAMAQTAFAEFLSERIMDVITPPEYLTGAAKPDGDAEAWIAEMVAKIGGKPSGPARLMELSRGLHVKDTQEVKEVVNTATGEVQLRFESAHQDAAGAPLTVPTLFLIAIPVFHNGPLYQLPVRIRYRLRGGAIRWTMKLHRSDLCQDHAFREACQRAAAETALPLFYGAPE